MSSTVVSFLLCTFLQSLLASTILGLEAISGFLSQMTTTYDLPLMQMTTNRACTKLVAKLYFCMLYLWAICYETERSSTRTPLVASIQTLWLAINLFLDAVLKCYCRSLIFDFAKKQSDKLQDFSWRRFIDWSIWRQVGVINSPLEFLLLLTVISPTLNFSC